MKKILFLALTASALLSCSDDDSNTTGNNAAVSGKWKLTAITSNQAVDGNDDGVATTNLLVEGGSCFADSYLQFNANNAVTNFISIPMMEDNCFTASADGVAATNGNNVVVTLTYEGETDVTAYVKDSNKLTATIPDFYEVEVTVNGQTTTASLDATLVYTKQ